MSNNRFLEKVWLVRKRVGGFQPLKNMSQIGWFIFPRAEHKERFEGMKVVEGGNMLKRI